MAVTPSVSVVVPTLNEEHNVGYVLGRIPAMVTQVILVDGGSRDDTVAVARQFRPDIQVVQQTRTGKGNALACGFAEATGDIVVMIDADGSTDPAEIPRFVDALCNGADFAKGSRFTAGGGSTDITRLRKIGNDGLNTMVNVLFGTRYTDLCYGYNAFWRSVIPAMQLPPVDAPKPANGKLWGDGFEVETLMNIRVSVNGFRIREVPSHEAARRYGESNLNTFRDGRRVLRTVLDEYRNRSEHTAPKTDGTPKATNRPHWLQSVSAQASAGATGALVAGRAVSSLLLGNVGSTGR
jgi:glycosyltransferase involved in cell wall biosynthesis